MKKVIFMIVAVIVIALTGCKDNGVLNNAPMPHRIYATNGEYVDRGCDNCSVRYELNILDTTTSKGVRHIKVKDYCGHTEFYLELESVFYNEKDTAKLNRIWDECGQADLLVISEW